MTLETIVRGDEMQGDELRESSGDRLREQIDEGQHAVDGRSERIRIITCRRSLCKERRWE